MQYFYQVHEDSTSGICSIISPFRDNLKKKKRILEKTTTKAENRLTLKDNRQRPARLTTILKNSEAFV